MARWTLALLLLAVVTCDRALGDCRQFFVKQHVVAPVFVAPVVQAVAVSPYLYQAGRDIEADALAEKVARLVAQKLSANVQQQTAPSTSVISQHCAKCHSGAAPKAGITLDGTTPLLCSQITASLRAIAADQMPKDHKIDPAVKGQIMQQLLDLERKEDLP